MATNGRYVFLTDHSHIGGEHLIPTTDEYDVFLLNKLILKLFDEYLYTPSCSDSAVTRKIGDTTYVYNPKIIAHVVSDSSRINKFNNPYKKPDTNYVVFNNPPNPDTTGTKDTLQKNQTTDSTIIEKEKFRSFKYYPNPTTGNLTIEVDGVVDLLYLADISGKLLAKYDIRGQKKITINIGNYPSGVYFLQCFLENKWVRGKIILVH
ncbi:MAG: T9SS type A sorting domain-containing protein [Bacteroidetes bacterium]|nr:T9SS type A sorting domain-containing protein [Bacteroidota bacterium]